MTPLALSDFLKRASTVASYYGFEPLTSLKASVVPKHKFDVPDTLLKDPLCELAAQVAKRCITCEGGTTRHLFLYHAQAARTQGKVRNPATFSLSAVGSQKSISEALILKTSLAILQDLGVEKTTVHINSIGDRDSNARFARELTLNLRKTIDKLSPPCREALKRDPFEALELILAENNPLRDNLPRPIHFLSEGSRKHLREIVEFLEYSGIPYVIEDHLVGNRDLYSQTLFEIRDEDEGIPRTIVRGGRFDELSKRNLRVTLPLVSALFSFRGKSSFKAPTRARVPRFFLIQLGFSAKLLALSLLENLRKARIPIRGSFEHDSLKEQLERARGSGASYLIIMGQREVLDKTAIVRHIDSQAQMIVPIGALAGYLKKDLAA